MAEMLLTSAEGQPTYDVLKAEIHRKAMQEIATEMGITLVRTSGSSVVTEAKDLSCAVLDEKGEQIGFSSYVATHISCSFLGVQAVMRNYKPDDLAPGDAFVVNDPHSSGALHEGDVGVIMPYFHNDELVAWGYVNEHMLDVGGAGVSGFAASARDCFSEGLRFPAIRFMRKGEFSPEWRMFIGNNVRAPDAVLNDMRSMVAAVNTGQRRLSALLARTGLEQHREFCEINKYLSERLVRQRIAALPDGRYHSKDWIEYDGLGEQLLLELSVTMEVKGDQLELRFRGAKQIAGPVNGAMPAVLGQSMNTLQCVLLYEVPVNAGLWRPISFDLGMEGTIVNSVPPAGVCFAHVSAGFKIDKLLRDVLSQAASLSSERSIRARICSQPCEGDFFATLSGVERKTGLPTVIFPVAPTVGMGGPAQTNGDGQDTYSNTCNLGIGMAAVEVDESTTPVLILWRSIEASSGGPGTTRGGNGMTTAFQIYGADELSGSVSNNSADVPARGIGGGWSGSATHFDILSDTNLGKILESGKLPEPGTLSGRSWGSAANVMVSVKEGDIFHVRNGGGGGLGDPLLRPPGSVAADVTDGYTSAQLARAVHGVVLNSEGQLDEAATTKCREGIRAQRLGGSKPSRPLLAHTELEPGVSIRVENSNWACGYCAGSLGPVHTNYRSICIEHVQQAPLAMAAIGMRVRTRTADQLEIADYFCPHCASCIRSDVRLEDEGMVSAPELA